MEIISHYLKFKDQNRRVRVLLPKSYERLKSKKYPVLYIHDGQNVYYNEESYSGISWGIREAIEESDKIQEMLVVAIDNSHQRMDEFSPFKMDKDSDPHERISPEGDLYADFIIKDLKPFIDKTYRTKTSRKNTAMVGSSAGGTITAYMGAKYGSHIGNIGVFSLASWIFEKDFSNYIEKSKTYKNTKYYIRVGVNEGIGTDAQRVSQKYINESLAYTKTLAKKGIPLENIRLNIGAGDQHCERDWRKYIKEILEYFYPR